MPGKSATRVLQGFGQVVEVLVSKQQPIIAQKLARMQYHMTELIHLMAELKDDWSRQRPPKEASNNSKDKVVVVDPIGFASIPDSEENRIKDKANINTKNMKESTVPASQMARLWNFGTLATRLANYSVVYSKENTVGQKVTDRLIALCTKDYFTNDLKYLVVRTIFNGNKQKFNKMMMNPDIIKMTMK